MKGGDRNVDRGSICELRFVVLEDPTQIVFGQCLRYRPWLACAWTQEGFQRRGVGDVE